VLKRSIKVEARMNESEYFQLKRIARAAGLSVAAFIRRCCLTNEKVKIIDQEVIRDLYREINYIGHNINQITRLANTDKRIEPESLQRVETWLEEVKRLIDKKLGGLNL
jgi:hypothetical protein